MNLEPLCSFEAPVTASTVERVLIMHLLMLLHDISPGGAEAAGVHLASDRIRRAVWSTPMAVTGPEGVRTDKIVAVLTPHLSVNFHMIVM